MASWATPVWHIYPLRCLRARDSIREQLHASGVDTLIHYPIPPHLSQAYAGSRDASIPQPLATRLASELLSLPIWPTMTDAQVEWVAERVSACTSDS